MQKTVSKKGQERVIVHLQEGFCVPNKLIGKKVQKEGASWSQPP